VKNFVQDNIATIAARIDITRSVDVSLSLLGRLNKKEGFFDFLKTFVKYAMVPVPFDSDTSSSFGCARYGILKFLENRSQAKVSFVDRVSLVCKEYF